MAASISRIIRKALPEIIQSKDATASERLEACRPLRKIRTSATKGNPRGRAFAKKANSDVRDHWDRLDRLFNGSELIALPSFDPESSAFISGNDRSGERSRPVEAPHPYPFFFANGGSATDTNHRDLHE